MQDSVKPLALDRRVGWLGRDNGMVVGLVLVSTLVAAVCGGLSVLLGGGWIGALLVYFSTGTATSFMLLLRLIILELHRSDGGPASAMVADSVSQRQSRTA